jgi:hypothetical protein
MCINQQLLDAHQGDFAAEQITYDWLMLVQEFDQLGLAILTALHLIEYRDQNLRFEFQG